MWLLNLPLNLRKFARMMEIIWLICAHFVHDWYISTSLAKLLRKKAKTAQDVQNNTSEARIRKLIEDLGPTFVKFGQILADRPDLVSEKLRMELKKLQTAARPIPDEEALKLIEHELGGPIDIFFQSMNLKCLASASIGQVYAGVLKNGEKVVVKIQRPRIQAKIKIDLKLLKVLAISMSRRYPQATSLNVVSFVDEFSESLQRELNYHSEAANTQRFRELMKNEPIFYAPRVYNEFTTQRLLIMEFIDGIEPDKIEQLKAEGYDLEKIAENGANILLQMVLKHGVFHADPHAGNIFILPGNRVCLIDYGMVAVLRPAHIQFLADFTIGFAMNSPKKIADALVKLSGKRFFDFAEDLRFDVQETINRYSFDTWEKVDIAAIMLDCISLIVKYKLQIPSSIYMLLKAIAAMSKFGERLSPTFEFSALLVPYAKEVVRKGFSPKQFFGELTDVIGDYIDMIKELPRDINEILYKAKQGRIVHEISLKEDNKLRKSIRIFSMNLGLGIVTVVLIICSTILDALQQAPGIANIEFIGGLFCGGWLVMRSLRGRLPE